MTVDATTLVAIYAAIIATAAFALETRRWVEARARLRISIMAPAHTFGGDFDDDQEYLFATVSNVGAAPTTLTHFGLVCFPSMIARVRNRPAFSAWVGQPKFSPAPLPYVIQPGTEWSGAANFDEELKNLVKQGGLYIAFFHSAGSRPAIRKIIIREPS